MKTSSGIIYIKNTSQKFIIETFLSYYSGIGYVKFEKELPKNYPSESEEFKEFLISRKTVNGYFIVVLEEFEHTFEVAYSVSKRLSDSVIVAIKYSYTKEPTLKMYKGKDVLLKIGSDEDHELMFYPPLLNEKSLKDAMKAVNKTTKENFGKIDVQTMIHMLELPNTDQIIDSIKQKQCPEDFDYILLINKRSALYLNM